MSQASATPQQVTHLKDYQAPNFVIDSVHFNFDLRETHTELTATTRYTHRAGSPRELEWHGKGFELVEVTINGVPVDDIETTSIGIRLRKLPETFEMVVKTRLQPDLNKSGMGLFKSETLYCTQMEAQGMQTITYFLDRPDALSVFTTVIEADQKKFPDLLSNGNLISTETLPSGRHRATWNDPWPKPAYLFALVAGDLDHISDTFTTQSGRQVDLKIYTEKGQADRCTFAMEALKRSFKWDEERFGREYDLDLFMIVAVRDFNMGAMENKGLNVFNSSVLLASPTLTTDERYHKIEAIIGHEYFHNWSGNRVTCRDWFQLCLKEGFTVFRDQEFSADTGSRGLQRVRDVVRLRSKQFSEDSGPLAHPVRPESFVTIDNFYTPTIYEKGAELIRMQQQLLGAETFRRGCDLYFSRFDGQAVRMEDFLACMTEVSGRDLSQFARWYSQAGTPELRLERGQTSSGDLELHFTQHTAPTPGQPLKKPLHLPFKVGFLTPDGREIKEVVLEITKERESFAIAGVAPDVVISPLREFSAPVNLIWSASDAELETLIQFDRDPFNSWEAWQKFYLTEFGALLGTQTIEASAAKLARVLKGAVSNHKKDPEFAAFFFDLPSVQQLQKDFGAKFSFDGVVMTRKELHLQMAKLLKVDLLNLIQEQSAPSRGPRALKNAALLFAALAPDSAFLQKTLEHLKNAANMTDEVAALAALNRHAGATRDEANQIFYQKWKNEPLAIDNWLVIKNVCTSESILKEKESEAQSEFGQDTNPNRNRAVYESFAVQNPEYFHHRSGRGYALIAKRVLEIDGYNPQLSSQLCQTLGEASVMDAIRKKLAHQNVEHILRAKISENLREVASKIGDSLQAWS